MNNIHHFKRGLVSISVHRETHLEDYINRLGQPTFIAPRIYTRIFLTDAIWKIIPPHVEAELVYADKGISLYLDGVPVTNSLKLLANQNKINWINVAQPHKLHPPHDTSNLIPWEKGQSVSFYCKKAKLEC